MVRTTQSNFSMQARTGRARGNDGQPTKATVFTAFAGKDRGSDTFQVELNSQRNGGLIGVAATCI